MQRIKIKQRIKQWEKQYLRDKYRNIIPGYHWNQIVREEIEKLQTLLQDT